MKKKLAKVIAMALVCAMTLPSVVYASTATAPSLSANNMPVKNVSTNDPTISGDGIVDTATYNVILPSRLDFAVDKFEVADQGQIYGENYPIVNASPMAVRIDVSVSAAGAISTNYVSTSDNAALTSEDDKAVYLAAFVPQDFTLSSLSVSAGAVSSTIISSANYTMSDNVVFPVTSENKAEFSFKLDRTLSMGSLVTSANCATFTWTGQVNDNVEWKDREIGVKATFHMKGMAQAPYKALESTSSNNLVTGGGGGGSTVPLKAYSRAAAADVIFDLPAGKTVTAISAVGTGSNTTVRNPASNSGFPWVSTAGSITFKGDAGVFNGSNAAAAWPIDTYTITLTLSDGTTKTIKLQITA